MRSAGVVLMFLCSSVQLQQLVQARKTRRPFTQIFRWIERGSDGYGHLLEGTDVDAQAPNNDALWAELDGYGSRASSPLRVLLNRTLNRTAAARPPVRTVLESEFLRGERASPAELARELGSRA